MGEDVIEHLEVGQNVQLHVMEVPAGWWCARNYILPPNALLGTGMEWQSEEERRGRSVVVMERGRNGERKREMRREEKGMEGEEARAKED
ncbi:hypothetical protein niasHT_029016 [Heterodera trifolii]|uniref:Uncharacterized protein n=1 Tax=Heterodera trifolii TaxID=157864 RepID=A0ABD2KSA0_9BILA